MLIFRGRHIVRDCVTSGGLGCVFERRVTRCPATMTATSPRNGSVASALERASPHLLPASIRRYRGWEFKLTAANAAYIKWSFAREAQRAAPSSPKSRS